MKILDKNDGEKVEDDSPINCYERDEVDESQISKATVIFSEDGNIIFWSKMQKEFLGGPQGKLRESPFLLYCTDNFQRCFTKKL